MRHSLGSVVSLWKALFSEKKEWNVDRRMNPHADIHIDPIPEWVRQDRDAVRDVHDLARRLSLTPEALKGAEEAGRCFRMKITPYYLGLMDPADTHCPIVRMAVPDPRELLVHESELEDPTGDESVLLHNQPVPGLVHRYPDRALLLPTTRCASYCRHCFRRRLAGKPEQNATELELSAAIRYIREQPAIREVILSGGDPLMMPDERLFSLLSRLRKIPHVRVLRIHTRMPVVNPYRITENFAKALSRFRPLFLVLHVNHPREVTTLAADHWRLLSMEGIPLLNQSVLLKGVNDSPDTLKELGWRLIESGVTPYYLHHLDLAKGLRHFRVPVREGILLMRSLQGMMPGYAIPRYVLDIPGGYGKVPLQHPYLNEDRDSNLLVESPKGEYLGYADMK